MKKMQVNSAGGAFELIEERLREPAAGYVRVKVQACGVCHSDSLTKEGLWPGLVYPRSPGHEIMGVIDAVGEGTEPWKAGDRVGIGWLCLPKTLSGMTRGWAYGNEAAEWSRF